VDPIRTIVVAVDFSRHSDAAVDAAIDLARHFAAKVHVVHAFALPIPLVTPYEVTIPEPYVEQTRKAAADKLAAVVARIREAGVAVDAELGEVPAAAAVVRAAESCDADLVVVGTRGHTGVKHLLLGSTAERTVRLAPCPVLTVKADDD
jgi:nucleotide-binding universal stress UspA family protein